MDHGLRFTTPNEPHPKISLSGRGWCTGIQDRRGSQEIEHCVGKDDTDVAVLDCYTRKSFLRGACPQL